MGNKQHSWSGQLAKDASSTSRSGYEWKTPKTFGCRSLNHWSLKTQQDPRWLDSNQTEFWETSLSPGPEGTWTEHWIRRRHFSVLALPEEGEGRKDGLELMGLNMRIIQTQAGWTVTCHVAIEEVNIGQWTIFNQANKKYLFELSCQQRTHSKEYVHPSLPLPSHISLLFFISKWGISGQMLGQTTELWVRSSLSNALLLSNWRDAGQMSQVSIIFLFNRVVFLLRPACWNYNGQICLVCFEANLKK